MKYYSLVFALLGAGLAIKQYENKKDNREDSSQMGR